MELKGTVLNVVDFGAFVDIGLKDSGLVHISQLANRYIKSPHDVVSVGDVVTVWVMGVDQERKRVSLTMVKPGTERPRGGRRRRRPARRRTSRPRGSGAGPGPEGPVAAAASQRLRADVAAGRRPVDRHAGRAAGRDGPNATAASAGRPGGPHGQPGPGEEGARAGRRSPRPSAPRFGPGPGSGRGGPRGGHFGHGPGRAAAAAGPRAPGSARGPRPRPAPPSRPSRPSPPPPPLSKEALTGSVPLRTFGQLKQLWEARVEPGDEPQASPPTRHGPPPAPQAEPAEAPPSGSPTPEMPPRPAAPRSRRDRGEGASMPRTAVDRAEAIDSRTGRTGRDWRAGRSLRVGCGRIAATSTPVRPVDSSGVRDARGGRWRRTTRSRRMEHGCLRLAEPADPPAADDPGPDRPLDPDPRRDGPVQRLRRPAEPGGRHPQPDRGGDGHPRERAEPRLQHACRRAWPTT